MEQPDYLVCYYPYSREVSGIYRVVGYTEKYWKCRAGSDGEYFLVGKKTLRSYGGEQRYEAWSRTEVQAYQKRRKLIAKMETLKPSSLTNEQMEAILKIVEDKNEVQSS